MFNKAFQARLNTLDDGLLVFSDLLLQCQDEFDVGLAIRPVANRVRP